MEILKYIQEVYRLDNASDLIIDVDNLSYAISREKGPVFTMGYSQARDFETPGRKICSIDFVTKDITARHIKDGQDLKLICVSKEQRSVINLINIRLWTRKVNITIHDEIEYTVSLTSDDLSVEYE